MYKSKRMACARCSWPQRTSPTETWLFLAILAGRGGTYCKHHLASQKHVENRPVELMHNMPQSRGLDPNYCIIPSAKVSAGKPRDGCPSEQVGVGPVEQLQHVAELHARRGGPFRMPLCAALDMPEAAGSPEPWHGSQMHLAQSLPGGAAECKHPGNLASSGKSFRDV